MNSALLKFLCVYVACHLHPDIPIAARPSFLTSIFKFEVCFEQAYSLDKVQDYRHQLETSRLGVPYFVRDLPKFERSHAVGSRNRSAFSSELCFKATVFSFPADPQCLRYQSALTIEVQMARI